jgi:hypothetical protein
MTKEHQSHLSELENLKGIRIVMTDEGEPLFIGLSYQQRTSAEEKPLAWMFWTAVAILYGVAALVIWWVV